MDWAQTSLIIGIAATILSGIGILITKILPFVRKVLRFIDRVSGVPADEKSGQAEVVGLFARMDHQDGQLSEIRHELFPNSGKSLRDAVDQQGRDLKAHIEACPPAPTTTINVNGGTQ